MPGRAYARSEQVHVRLGRVHTRFAGPIRGLNGLMPGLRGPYWVWDGP